MPVGITQPIYLNGYVFNFPPVSVLPVPAFAETVRRVRDGKLIPHTHRGPITNPDVSSKFRFEVEWDEFTEADVRMYLRCLARRGPFTFCPWILWQEDFMFLTGETVAGSFQRTDAKTVIPSALATGTPATEFDAEFYVSDVLSADFTLGTAVSGRTPWTSTVTAPALVSGIYAPLFSVRVVDQTPVLRGWSQGGKIVLEEY